MELVFGFAEPDLDFHEKFHPFSWQVFVLTEQELAVDYQEGVSAVQTTPSNILVTFHAGKNETSTELSAPAQAGTNQLKDYLVKWVTY